MAGVIYATGAHEVLDEKAKTNTKTPGFGILLLPFSSSFLPPPRSISRLHKRPNTAFKEPFCGGIKIRGKQVEAMALWMIPTTQRPRKKERKKKKGRGQTGGERGG